MSYALVTLFLYLYRIIPDVFSRPVLELGFGLHGETLTEAENYLQIFSLTIPLNLLIGI